MKSRSPCWCPKTIMAAGPASDEKALWWAK